MSFFQQGLRGARTDALFRLARFLQVDASRARGPAAREILIAILMKAEAR